MQRLGPPGWRLAARLMTSLSKEIAVAKSEEVKTYGLIIVRLDKSGRIF
jgi:hypothetical protein